MLIVTFVPLSTTTAGAAPPAQGWTTTEGPLPADAGNGSTDPQAYVSSSACPAANVCVSVGWYSDTSGHTWGLIETQNGTTWTDTEAPQPSDSGTGSNQGFWFGSQSCGFAQPCRAVSCPSASFCVAVGQYMDSGGFRQAVIETDTNGTWTSSTAALPSDAATDATVDHPNNQLFSVSCSSPTSCVAVGRYVDQAGNAKALVDTLSGSSWTGVAAPLPTGASPTNNTLLGISCASPTSCAASGGYHDNTSGGDLGLLEVLANGVWTPTPAPLPSNADTGSSQHALLLQTSCPSTAFCVANGIYRTSGAVKPVLETWNGTSWSGIEGPLPGDDDPTVFDALTAVSCASPSLCVAVGTYETSSRGFGLIDTYSGGTWTGAKAPEPADAATSGSPLGGGLTEVACPTPAFCLSAGADTLSGASGNRTVPIVDTLSGGAWASVAAPIPANVTTSSTFVGQGRTVACDSPVACIVGGPYEDTSGHGQVFLDTWTGGQGYWLDASDGGIFTYPNNAFYGSTGSLRLNKPMVGMAATPDGQGYWLVASDGGIFSYGDAAFQGSRGGQPLNAPIVGMASTPDGKGYWLVATDGGMFSYGDAGFFGSRGGQPLNKPIVGMAATPDGKGYWLVASDGGIFSYGDAHFYGSTGSMVLNKPVVGMASSATGLGYWLVASDGGIFSYGDTSFYGSTGSMVLNKPVVGMATSPSGKGYWFVASDGGIFNYGDAAFQGSAGSLHLNVPVVGMAAG